MHPSKDSEVRAISLTAAFIEHSCVGALNSMCCSVDIKGKFQIHDHNESMTYF